MCNPQCYNGPYFLAGNGAVGAEYRRKTIIGGLILRKYEAMLILRPDLEEEQVKAVFDEVAAIVVKDGGGIKNVDDWGVRRLEYQIKHEETGHYAVINFNAGAEIIKELERVMAIRDEVLRTKVVVLGEA